MTEAYRTAALTEAIRGRAAARRIFDRAVEDLRRFEFTACDRAARLKFVQAEEELNLWQSKVAGLDRPAV